MAARNLRVTVSKNAGEIIALAKKIISKHQADGASSIFNHIDIANFINQTSIAETEHQRMEQLKKEAEIATEKRNIALGFGKKGKSGSRESVVFFVKTCRDVLKGLNKGQEHQLGDWGFEVQTSPKAKKIKKHINNSEINTTDSQ